jgi:LacI family transcriptional regulator
VRDPRISMLSQAKARYVGLGRVLGQDDFWWVDVDGTSGVRVAVEHLLALGHRRVGFLGTPRDFSFSHFRHEGYLQALLAAEIVYDSRLVIEDLEVSSDLSAPIQELLALDQPPTALVACADFLAVGALRVARALGVNVPRNLSLIAFDDTLLTQQSDPPLTCIRQDNQLLGTRIATLLLEQLQHDTLQPSHELLQPLLVVRSSTAPPVQ